VISCVLPPHPPAHVLGGWGGIGGKSPFARARARDADYPLVTPLPPQTALAGQQVAREQLANTQAQGTRRASEATMHRIDTISRLNAAPPRRNHAPHSRQRLGHGATRNFPTRPALQALRAASATPTSHDNTCANGSTGRITLPEKQVLIGGATRNF
jgi:hypothetical protein